MTALKPDAEAIERFICTLAERLHLDSTHSWWPHFLFHTTDLENAIEILESGVLLSRRDAGHDHDEGHSPQLALELGAEVLSDSGRVEAESVCAPHEVR